MLLLAEKDVVRTDRHLAFFREDGPHLVQLNDILLTYTFFNFDLGTLPLQYNVVLLLLEISQFWWCIHRIRTGHE